MATYVLGDIQGCYKTLRALLASIAFHPSRDRLWCCGDLVNRGPQNLEVLLWAMDLGESFQTVLGNHDLHLIGRLLGLSPGRHRDTLEDVLMSSHAGDCLEWLCRQALYRREGREVWVHAGLHPHWTLSQVEKWNAEFMEALRGPRREDLMKALVQKNVFFERRDLLDAVAVLTRVRMCDYQGNADFSYSGSPESAPAHLRPWFDFESIAAHPVNFYVGHWAALGWYRRNNVTALDTGCVWGRSLSAYCLESGQLFSQPYVE